jgi:alpha-1,2-mannosyltransferase
MALSCVAVIAWFGPWNNASIDLIVYEGGARAVLRGEPLYSWTRDFGWGQLPFTYPPLGVLLFMPLVLMPLPVWQVIWLVASIACLMFIIDSALRLPLPGGRTLAPGNRMIIGALAVAALLWLEPVRRTFYFSQVNLFLGALVVADATGRTGRVPRGILTGLAAAIKLTPAFFIVYFLIRRRWRDAAVATASAIGFTLLAAAIMPKTSWTYYTATIFDPTRPGTLEQSNNQSIRGAVARLALTGTTASALWAALSLVVVIASLWIATRTADRFGEPMGVSVAGIGAVLISPISWNHHWFWAAPLLLAIGLIAWTARDRTLGVTTVLGSVIMYCGFMFWIPYHHQFELHHNAWQKVVADSYVIFGFGLLAVLAFTTASPRWRPAELHQRTPLRRRQRGEAPT